MKSPITGGNATLKREPAELVFRNEKYEYIYSYYVCDDTGEHFTTSELDEVNIGQVYNQYRVKYGIPFPDEIKKTRSKYGLPAIKMARILGWGDNQYRLYENGDVPSQAHGKTLAMIRVPQFFLDYVENSRNQFEEGEFERIQEKVKSVRIDQYELFVKDYVFYNQRIGLTNGYATQSISKLKNIMLYYIQRFGGVFFTMMNKLLFYTDFVNYRDYGRGMSGLSYMAIKYGPVPVGYNRAYSIPDIRQRIIYYESGKYGQVIESDLSPDMNTFTEEELSTLENVANRFSKTNAGEISDISHEEEAWKKYVDTGMLIDFNEAFSLKAL